jgi:uncharacterized membrane protein YkvA (DUF1232 family)
LLELFRLLILAGTLIIVTFLVLLALPQCKLRQLAMPFVAWGFVALCAAYAISPVDAMPEVIFGPLGLIDDLGAVAAGIGTAMATINAKKNRSAYDPSVN